MNKSKLLLRLQDIEWDDFEVKDASKGLTLVEKLSVNDNVNVRINISKLKAKGLIERIGSDKSGYWRVKE